MKHRSKKKQAIYNAAARLFSTKGYPSASIRDIAEQVGLEPSSLYSHIKSKEEILVDICTSCADQFEQGMDLICSTYQDALGRLGALVDLHIDIAYKHPVSVTVFNDEWRHLPEADLALFLSKRKAYENRFMEIIGNGIDQGLIRNVSKRTSFNVLIQSANWMHYYAGSLGEEELKQKKEEIRQILFEGMTIK